MWDAISIVITIFLMIATGWILTHIGWMTDSSATLLSKLVVKVALPATVISNMLTKYTRESLIKALPQLVIPYASILLLVGMAKILIAIFHIPKSRRGSFTQMFAFSNTVFIGVPVTVALFGQEALPIALLFYIANTTLFWTIGVAGVRADGGAPKVKLFSMEMLKQLATVPLVTFLVCGVLVMLNVKAPKFILDYAGYIGALVTPLSLLFTGIVLHSIQWKTLKLDLSMIFILIGRFIVSPLVCWLLCIFLPNVSALALGVFVVQAGMPTMSQTAIVARLYNADEEYATIGTALSTLLSLLFIPLYKLLLSH